MELCRREAEKMNRGKMLLRLHKSAAAELRSLQQHHTLAAALRRLKLLPNTLKLRDEADMGLNEMRGLRLRNSDLPPT